MGMDVQTYNDDGIEWDMYVASHPYSTNYHRYAWRNVIEKSFGHRTQYLVVRRLGQEIRGILPLVHMKSRLFGNLLISLPFFNYGGLLCKDADAASSLLDEVRRMVREARAQYAELRHLDKCKDDLETKEHKVTMILDLEKEEKSQWKALDAKVRNQVRKAEKSGMQTICGHMELLDGFYKVFCRNMRDLGTPVYGKAFFYNILATFPETTRIISVMLNGKTVASGILTWFRETLEVPWASSIADYRDKCPNNLLYWEAIRFAIENGARKFDFGRSFPGDGCFRFKKQWGAEPVQLYWQYLLEKGEGIRELNRGNPKYQLAIKLWRKLPLALTNVLGPRIVKNIP